MSGKWLISVVSNFDVTKDLKGLSTPD